MLTVFNKIDTCNPLEVEGLVRQHDGVAVCALDRSTFAPLLEAMEAMLWPPEEDTECEPCI